MLDLTQYEEFLDEELGYDDPDERFMDVYQHEVTEAAHAEQAFENYLEDK